LRALGWRFRRQRRDPLFTRRTSISVNTTSKQDNLDSKVRRGSSTSEKRISAFPQGTSPVLLRVFVAFRGRDDHSSPKAFTAGRDAVFRHSDPSITGPLWAVRPMRVWPGIRPTSAWRRCPSFCRPTHFTCLLGDPRKRDTSTRRKSSSTPTRISLWTSPTAIVA
jgi:hypothetical protein